MLCTVGEADALRLQNTAPKPAVGGSGSTSATSGQRKSSSGITLGVGKGSIGGGARGNGGGSGWGANASMNGNGSGSSSSSTVSSVTSTSSSNNLGGGHGSGSGHISSSSSGGNGQHGGDKEEFNIGLIAPHTNFGKRDYLRAINVAIQTLNKLRGTKLPFLEDYAFSAANVHFDMMSLTPSPTSKCVLRVVEMAMIMVFLCVCQQVRVFSSRCVGDWFLSQQVNEGHSRFWSVLGGDGSMVCVRVHTYIEVERCRE